MGGSCYDTPRTYLRGHQQEITRTRPKKIPTLCQATPREELHQFPKWPVTQNSDTVTTENHTIIKTFKFDFWGKVVFFKVRKSESPKVRKSEITRLPKMHEIKNPIIYRTFNIFPTTSSATVVVRFVWAASEYKGKSFGYVCNRLKAYFFHKKTGKWTFLQRFQANTKAPTFMQLIGMKNIISLKFLSFYFRGTILILWFLFDSR